MKNLIEYMPIILLLIGFIFVAIAAFLFSKVLGFLIMGVLFILVAYIVSPKKGVNTWV